ncbi:MAG: hypothetical protein JGK30_26005 [Microcoleus sp. PH2017_40_RAT_O_B]|uniref:hypothetical protein n=1 Tax=unclassified Microcoleus TaxID=2642155 RepID=UPI001D8EBE1B|nr:MULTISPECIES: hypothetical protein [unclassified Microcoleus]MCC3575252.1 hypothetical protein [Microcoleus sp. PH2017_34_RAT_O_A]MCC3612830.1 hypothetical protein [Microcoleus sp. PH2017_40_RAT_O_B]
MNHKISELQTRYSLSSKQSVYDRMKALHIETVKRGEISSDSLDKLDNLDKFLKNNPGATLSDFPKNAEAVTASKLDSPTGQLDLSTEQLDLSTGQLDNFNETLKLVEAIARHFKVETDPLAKYKALEYAANHILLLPTSKIQELIKVKPRKSPIEWGNFIIWKKTEVKIGREMAWSIQMKPSAFRPPT